MISVISLPASAQCVVKLRIEGVETNAGEIHLSLFNNEQTYKAREAFLKLVIAADDETQMKELSLPEGYYLVAIYQDSNGNGKLDTNKLGIPREKFGFSNYDGKTFPGNFNRHRVRISDDSNEITVVLVSL